jgi:hypothetical protein
MTGEPRSSRRFACATALERADRLAIVPVLGVEVVLDDQRPAPPRPVEQRGAASRREHGPGGELVRGGHQHRIDARRREPVDLEAVAIHGNRHGP